MVALKDIAAQCGVSVATVSKALNNQKDIGAKTKEQIQKTAMEMGYFPNAAARALKTKRSYNLGVLFQEEAGSGLTHEYFAGILNGFKVAAEHAGFDISFINKGFENKAMSYYEHCKYRNFDGIIIVCVDYTEAGVLELLNCEDLPIVTIDYVHHNCTSVSSNNIDGINQLFQYIYSMGHRKIAYIHGQEHSYVTKERVASFFRAAQAHQLTIPDEYLRTARYLETKEAAKATTELLSLSDPPTCILYPDDLSLIGGRNAIAQMGLQIPTDISIAGYDGIRMSQLLHPKLTTVHQNTDAIGKEAAMRLIKAIEFPKTTLVKRIVVEGTLMKGYSVGQI